MPPVFSGPPISRAYFHGNKNQWTRLDPSELLVHSLKCHDQLDDYIEMKMRDQYIEKLTSKFDTKENPKLKRDIVEFVNGQTISEL